MANIPCLRELNFNESRTQVVEVNSFGRLGDSNRSFDLFQTVQTPDNRGTARAFFSYTQLAGFIALLEKLADCVR